jgi:hypothetical protein
VGVTLPFSKRSRADAGVAHAVVDTHDDVADPQPAQCAEPVGFERFDAQPNAVALEPHAVLRRRYAPFALEQETDGAKGVVVELVGAGDILGEEVAKLVPATSSTAARKSAPV